VLTAKRRATLSTNPLRVDTSAAGMYGAHDMLIYAAIGAVGFLLLVGMLVIGDVFGGDHDLAADHDTALDAHADHGGPGIFSIRIMAAFLTAFGVGGVVGRYYGLSHPAASGVGVAAGFVMATLVYQFARVLYGQQASSELKMATLIGKSGEVSVAIPAGGVGQVTLSLAGERSDHLARAAGTEAVPRGTEVVITALRGDGLVVKPTTPSGNGGR
jgi:membrane protein implicated in regulation of membrane protease activity